MVRNLARPRTFPQHTPPLLPLLRSRPGGVHKTSVVRSPGSDKNLAPLDFQSRLFKKLNLRFAVREHSQQAVNQKVRQQVRDYGYNDRQ